MVPKMRKVTNAARGTTLMIIALSGLSVMCHGQQDPSWAQWDWLMGEWVGEGSGDPGEGSGSFSFNLALDQRILVRRNHTEFPENERGPAMVHEDLMIVYPGESGMPENAIYFDNEGHIINYTISSSDQSIRFTSSQAPGVPVFRLTYTFIEDKTILTTFEMSQDGETFMTYLEGKNQRVL